MKPSKTLIVLLLRFFPMSGSVNSWQLKPLVARGSLSSFQGSRCLDWSFSGFGTGWTFCYQGIKSWDPESLCCSQEWTQALCASRYSKLKRSPWNGLAGFLRRHCEFVELLLGRSLLLRVLVPSSRTLIPKSKTQTWRMLRPLALEQFFLLIRSVLRKEICAPLWNDLAKTHFPGTLCLLAVHRVSTRHVEPGQQPLSFHVVFESTDTSLRQLAHRSSTKTTTMIAKYKPWQSKSSCLHRCQIIKVRTSCCLHQCSVRTWHRWACWINTWSTLPGRGSSSMRLWTNFFLFTLRKPWYHVAHSSLLATALNVILRNDMLGISHLTILAFWEEDTVPVLRQNVRAWIVDMTVYIKSLYSLLSSIVESYRRAKRWWTGTFLPFERLWELPLILLILQMRALPKGGYETFGQDLRLDVKVEIHLIDCLLNSRSTSYVWEVPLGRST